MRPDRALRPVRPEPLIVSSRSMVLPPPVWRLPTSSSSSYSSSSRPLSSSIPPPQRAKEPSDPRAATLVERDAGNEADPQLDDLEGEDE